MLAASYSMHFSFQTTYWICISFILLSPEFLFLFLHYTKSIHSTHIMYRRPGSVNISSQPVILSMERQRLPRWLVGISLFFGLRFVLKQTPVLLYLRLYQPCAVIGRDLTVTAPERPADVWSCQTAAGPGVVIKLYYSRTEILRHLYIPLLDIQWWLS